MGRPNGPAWVVELVALLESDATVLLLGSDSPAAERRRLIEAAGAGWVVLDGETAATSISSPPKRRGGVLLATSGTTGLPKLVHRTEGSLVEEGLRYLEGGLLESQDTVALPLPMTHAYALGWCAAALAAGAHLRPLEPTALGRAVAALRSDVTVVAVVPTLARALARWGCRSPGRSPVLRLVMAGAGPVDRELDDLFVSAFGISLARNYGSTETGALFAGPAGLPPMSIGFPLPGVAYRVVSEGGQTCRPGEVGLLEIRCTGTDRWRPMGDLVVEAAGDGPREVTVVGRRREAIRQGDRWVSAAEIAAVLRESSLVTDVHVEGRPGLEVGQNEIVATVVPTDAARFDGSELRAWARRQLAPYKVPTTIEVRSKLARTAIGKLRRELPVQLASPAQITWALRRYKISSALFALLRCGAFQLLDGTRTPAEIAAETSTDPEVLDQLLDALALEGLVREAPSHLVPTSTLAQVVSCAELEAVLAESWASQYAVAEVLQNGLRRRPFEREESTRALHGAYQRAMSGPEAERIVRVGLGLLRPPVGAHLVEIGSGPGLYLRELLARDSAATGELRQVSALRAAPVSEVQTGRRAAMADSDGGPGRCLPDAIVIVNSIHYAETAHALASVPFRTHTKVLVDDVFVDDVTGEGAELMIDWVTHGGTQRRSAPETMAWLESLGLLVRRVVPVGGLRRLLVAHPAGDEPQAVVP